MFVEFPTAGRWWRSSRYELFEDGGIDERHWGSTHIRAVENSTPEEYDPWACESGKLPKGGGKLNRPYLQLIQLADQAISRTTSSTTYYRRNAPDLVQEWVSEHGLLGFLLRGLRQVRLFPRWGPEPQWRPNFGGTIDLVMRRFVCEGDGWRDVPERVPIPKPPEGWLLEKPEPGTLVPRDYWSGRCEEPHVLIEHPPGYYHRKGISEEFGTFFRSIPKSELDTYAYPVPTSNEFWGMYSEPVFQIIAVASSFADAVRELGRGERTERSERAERTHAVSENLERKGEPSEQTDDGVANPSASDLSEFARGERTERSDKAEPQLRNAIQATFTLQSWADYGALAASVRPYGAVELGWGPAPLISIYAMMALADAARGHLNTCARCDTVFVSTAGRARFCSARCRKTALQSAWRRRKGSGVRDEENSEHAD